MIANDFNIVTETILFFFLLIRDNLLNPRKFTTEPCKHTFGDCGSQKRGNTGQNCVEREDKKRNKANEMYKS